MRSVLAVLMAFGILAVAFTQGPVAQSKSVTKVCKLTVTGMTCAGCEAAVRISAKTIDGVTSVAVSYERATAEVTYDPAKTTPAEIAKVIADKTGYKVIPQRERKK